MDSDNKEHISTYINTMDSNKNGLIEEDEYLKITMALLK